jgi:hypothetical protein
MTCLKEPEKDMNIQKVNISRELNELAVTIYRFNSWFIAKAIVAFVTESDILCKRNNMVSGRLCWELCLNLKDTAYEKQ